MREGERKRQTTAGDVELGDQTARHISEMADDRWQIWRQEQKYAPRGATAKMYSSILEDPLGAQSPNAVE